MTTPYPGDHRDLVDLVRRYSPVSLPTSGPELPPELSRLVNIKPPQRPRAVLFDVYGTLLISAAGGEPNRPMPEPSGGTDARRALESELTALNLAGGFAAIAGSISRAIEARLQQHRHQTPHPEIDILELVNELFPGLPLPRLRRLALLHEAAVNPCAPMPGAWAALTRLAASGFRLGLVSNAQFYTPLVLEALLEAPLPTLGLDPRLSIYSFELGVAKPSTLPFEMAEQALSRQGIAAADTVFVGNSGINDVAPAQARGFMTGLFAGDSRSFRPSAPGTPGSAPDLVLTSLKDLPILLA